MYKYCPTQNFWTHSFAVDLCKQVSATFLKSIKRQLTGHGAIAPPTPSSSASMLSICSSVNVHPSSSIFDLILDSLSLFIKGANPFCTLHFSRICVTGLSCAFATLTKVSSSERWLRTIGQYAVVTMPFSLQYLTISRCWQNGWSSIWLQTGVTDENAASCLMWWTPLSRSVSAF